MKTILRSIFLLFSIAFLNAQQISLGEISRTAKFGKLIDEINNGTTKIKYSDIKGIPYYYPEFIEAQIGDTSTLAPIRYNSFLDTVEIVNNDSVYQLPKDETTPSFTFETTKEKLVHVKTDDLYSGYFFELSSGKYRILKKVITKYQPATPAPNTLIAGSPAVFVPQKPLYFIKTENAFFKINNSARALANHFPEKAKQIRDFIGQNNIKLNNEEDLKKLGKFFNQ